MAQPSLLLFSSSTSRASLQAEDIVQKTVPGIKIVRLDTKEQRERAKNGKYFSIVSVPTLIAHHPSNKIDIWTGLDKIAELFKPRPAHPGHTDRDPRESRDLRDPPKRSKKLNMYDDPDGWRDQRRNDRRFLEESESSEDPPPSRVAFEESSEESEEPPPVKKSSKKPKPKLKKEKEAPPPRKPKASKRDDDLPSNKKGREEADQKLAALKRRRKGSGRMSSVLEKAKAQEAALKAALAE